MPLLGKNCNLLTIPKSTFFTTNHHTKNTHILSFYIGYSSLSAGQCHQICRFVVYKSSTGIWLVCDGSLLVYDCCTARHSLFTPFIFNVYDIHITSTPHKSHLARNLLKIDTKHGILGRKLTLVLLKHIYYTLNQYFSTKI